MGAGGSGHSVFDEGGCYKIFSTRGCAKGFDKGALQALSGLSVGGLEKAFMLTGFLQQVLQACS